MVCGSGRPERGTPYEETHLTQEEIDFALSYEEGPVNEVLPRINHPEFEGAKRFTFEDL